MKIILSRKGFDSSNGGFPSPILPYGTLLSLPIPYKNGIDYTVPNHNNKTYSEIIKELDPRRIKREQYAKCHLDPDIRYEAKKRDKEWKGLFGQSSAAQTHLENQYVKKDDVFLFFGWFRQATIVNNGFKFMRGAPDLHIIYGYLQIGEMYKKTGTPKFKHKDIKYHPHSTFNEGNDCIYEANDFLSFDKQKLGYGTFRYKPELVLTAKGMSRSKWKLPEVFRNANISYHSKDSFKNHYFQSANIGQEFVIECTKEILDWTKQIIIEQHDSNNHINT